VISLQKGFPETTEFWKNQKKTHWLGTAFLLKDFVNLTLPANEIRCVSPVLYVQT